MNREQDIVFIQKLNEAYACIRHLKNHYLYDDVKQEIALLLWETQDYSNLHEIVVKAAKKVFGNEKKHHIIKFQPGRNKQGEEIEEDYYLVDPATLPQYGVRKSPVTKKMRKTVAEMVECNDLIYQIFNRKVAKNQKSDVLRRTKTCEDLLKVRGFGFSVSLQKFNHNCFRGMLKNVRTNANVQD